MGPDVLQYIFVPDIQEDCRLTIVENSGQTPTSSSVERRASACQRL